MFLNTATLLANSVGLDQLTDDLQGQTRLDLGLHHLLKPMCLNI